MAFVILPLSESRKKSILSKTDYPTNSPVSINRMVEVHFDHFNFDGYLSNGEVIVFDKIGKSVLSLFKELLDLKFPIDKAIPVDEFDGDDILSMEANNSSAFNCRQIMNTDRWSSHAYGLAIDINPRQNPYVPNLKMEKAKVYPSGGEPFLDRTNLRKGMVESIVPIFKKHGFTDWGGNWESPLDYHHFQVEWERMEAFL